MLFIDKSRLRTQDFPWSSLQANAEPDLHDPGTKMAHMLALTARLAYEAPNLARQVCHSLCAQLVQSRNASCSCCIHSEPPPLQSLRCVRPLKTLAGCAMPW